MTELEKVEEWVEQSKATIRADVVHEKLTKMGYRGSERSTRRAVNAAKTAWKAGKRRTYRPWIPEPGRWLQFDWGEGPRIGGRRTWLFCARLSWSLSHPLSELARCRLRTAWTSLVIRVVEQRSLRRSRQDLRVAMACSTRARILAWDRLTAC